MMILYNYVRDDHDNLKGLQSSYPLGLDSVIVFSIVWDFTLDLERAAACQADKWSSDSWRFGPEKTDRKKEQSCWALFLSPGQGTCHQHHEMVEKVFWLWPK